MSEDKDLAVIVTDDCVKASLALDEMAKRAKAGEYRDVQGWELVMDSTYFYGEAAPPLAVPVSSVSEHPIFGEPKKFL